ncbi:MAG: dihydroxy-acid dehydratase [Desulfobacteraceae bacterium]|jgi:dihydroxy-acid dehydratase
MEYRYPGTFRVNIPAIVVNSGPMLGGIGFNGKKSDSTSVSEALGMLRSDKITEAEYKNIENLSCPTCGAEGQEGISEYLFQTRILC